MADLFQGSQLDPSVSTTQSQQTSPEFYTNYLQNITNLGQNAVANSGVAGMSPLQIQAMNLAPNAAFAGAGTMGTGANLTEAAGTTSAPSIVNQYMSPYISNVVDEMGRKQQQDIQRNVLPGLSAAGAATGNFGSKRQASATGQTLADMQANLIGQQYGALNTGYNTAMTEAQADLNRELQSGQALGNIGTQQANLGQSGLKTLTDLGGIERGVAQQALDQPMVEAQNYAKLMQGYQIPTGTTSQTTASGAYANSPLSDIAGIVSLLNSYNSGTSSGTSLNDATTASYIAAAAKNYGLSLQPDGTYQDASKNAFKWNGTSFVKAANGGLMSYADGGGVGSISGEVYNDASGGDTYAFADGGYVYDQDGNLIG